MIRAVMNANGITAINFPITPETKQSGRNVMTVVVTLETTLGATSAVPSIAAATRFLPSRR